MSGEAKGKTMSEDETKGDFQGDENFPKSCPGKGSSA